VVVHPSERLPADGVVIGGASAVDQSAITGESVPIEKTSGDPLFAGTINGNGTLLMSVERPASESTLARIIALVEAAQASKSPTEALTHRIERRYVPAILVATAALIVLPPVLGGGAWGVWFYRAMAFLTAASPCALAIGTPAAVLSGIARAARGGVLIKGGAHLEMLGRVRAIAFDKTGTLTSGHAVVTEVLSLNGAAVDEIVRYAAAVEKGSAHPLAQAIVADAESRNGFVTRAEDVRQQPGLGITGMVNGKTVAVGQPRLLATVQADVTNRMSELEAQGRTAVLVALDQTPIGIIGISDQPRASARRVVAELRAAGIEKVVVLTGDNAQSAAAIARDVGVQTCYAGLMPADKLARIHELRETYGCVAMVGDGVNDAPALAAADLGIAMGGAGTHVALETADVALMADDLAKLPEAIGLGRFSRRVIVQNLVIALGVIAVLAPCAALGMATLGVAVVFHEGSTVLVVLNALRLLAYRPRPSRVSQPSELQDACA
jgi:Cd2+/Zn2+-exporting ATPase